MPYKSLQASAHYLSQAMGILMNAQRMNSMYQTYAGRGNENDRGTIERCNKMVVQAIQQAMKHAQKGLDKLGGNVEDETNSW